MSDATHHHGDDVGGDKVVISGGTHVTGIVKYGSAGAAQDAELRAAVEELTRLLRELQGQVAPEQARAIEEALPALTPDRAALSRRGLTLAAVAQIAAAVGAVGQPVVDAVGRLLGLLGA
ncbi:hypothetical protein ACIGEZ_32520 [Streptomyces sp. NPDC085481]|uniref:hypothetical protein n=1 Tax=Streptomyces sp. NPDC085481 TaxID=3365727 RepID=UPI0037D3450B